MELAHPSWLLALLLLPLLAAGEWWGVRSDRDRTARLVSRALWGRVLRKPHEAWRFVRLGLLLAGAACVIVALAQPRWGLVREKIEREGVDVVLIADTSASMGAEDVQPNRLFVAKAALSWLLDRLGGSRFALVAVEGEAYPLVPLTLDADAVGLFLETMEPGIVPTPGTSLASGLEKALDMFVDKGRKDKVIVLASDGEDLDGGLDAAIRKDREAGVTVHTVGVGTEAGSPVPDADREGRRTGFKKDESGTVVISKLNEVNLKEIARATGGQYVHVTTASASAARITAAIEGMEQRTLAQEYTYRKKERFQWPLGVGLVAVALGLLLPPPRIEWRRRKPARAAGGQRRTANAARPAAAATLVLGLLAASTAGAVEQPKAKGSVVDEVLLRPQRFTSQGRKAYGKGDYPRAEERFEQAAGVRPDDPCTRFNTADSLFKSGKLDQAAELFRALGGDERSPFAAAARYNLGNVLLQKQDFKGAVESYRSALELQPGDADTRHNLEVALRALQEQQRKQQERQQQPNNDQNKQDKNGNQQQHQQKQEQKQPPRPPTQEEKEQERWKQETGMPKERAMQLLSALEQNEKDEQKKQLALLRAARKKGKDW
jgi:Ca-activated chloride channel family protein